MSVAQLVNPQKADWITKQGGSIKTWKKRWMVLKDDTLWYFKDQKSSVPKGFIKLEKVSVCQTEPSRNTPKHSYFSVKVRPEDKRTYLIHTDSDEKAKDWVEKIQAQINQLKGQKSEPSSPEPAKQAEAAPAAAQPSTEPVVSSSTTNDVEKSTPKDDTPEKTTPAATSSPKAVDKTNDVTPRGRLARAKEVIPFLQDEDSKVLEFWSIWSDSIPLKEDLQAGMAIEYHVSTSANMQKLTWRTAGPQNIFIQKMVDFFWNVGAPESEIDRLNDVGALINPIKIGSWIDMSAKGGMDGGWYFPVEISLKQALEAADAGDPTKKVLEWAEQVGVTKGFSVGRDMGAAPPRQTEIRVHLLGESFENQLENALKAFKMFNFPDLPENALSILKASGGKVDTPLALSVITSSEGFVRLGILVPSPDSETVVKLCELCGANKENLATFEGSLEADGPAYAEYQFLKEGFGYGVYKEGFDIVFHYVAGSEAKD